MLQLSAVGFVMISARTATVRPCPHGHSARIFDGTRTTHEVTPELTTIPSAVQIEFYNFVESNARDAALMVVSITFSPCASETKNASNCDGGR